MTDLQNELTNQLKEISSLRELTTAGGLKMGTYLTRLEDKYLNDMLKTSPTNLLNEYRRFATKKNLFPAPITSTIVALYLSERWITEEQLKRSVSKLEDYRKMFSAIYSEWVKASRTSFHGHHPKPQIIEYMQQTDAFRRSWESALLAGLVTITFERTNSLIAIYLTSTWSADPSGLTKHVATKEMQPNLPVSDSTPAIDPKSNKASFTLSSADANGLVSDPTSVPIQETFIQPIIPSSSNIVPIIDNTNPLTAESPFQSPYTSREEREFYAAIKMLVATLAEYKAMGLTSSSEVALLQAPWTLVTPTEVAGSVISFEPKVTFRSLDEEDEEAGILTGTDLDAFLFPPAVKTLPLLTIDPFASINALFASKMVALESLNSTSISFDSLHMECDINAKELLSIQAIRDRWHHSNKDPHPFR